MDGDGSGVRAGLIDLCAAMIAAAAVAICLMMLGKPLAALPAGAGMLLLSFSALQCVRPGPARYRLPGFTVPEWSEVVAGDGLEFSDVEPLVLDEPLPAVQECEVVRRLPVTSLPTPGELKRRIDAHLQGGTPGGEDENVVLLSPDASAALRHALAELKRSLG